MRRKVIEKKPHNTFFIATWYWHNSTSFAWLYTAQTTSHFEKGR